MPKINFGEVGEAREFSPLPKGDYRCRLVKVEETFTKDRDEMWRLRFRVEEGPEEGALIFDNLVFSEKALPRAKLICSRLGLDVSSELDITPALILDRTCIISVIVEDYEDPQGKTQQRNKVPFAGYASIEEPEVEEVQEDGGPDELTGDEKVPF